jgi:anti-anti-sigma regulatory factor
MVIEVKQKDEVCFLRCEGRFLVSDVGSAGIGFIVGVYMSTRNSGGHFVLVGLRPGVREVFDLTRVSTVIPLAADIASGLAIL